MSRYKNEMIPRAERAYRLYLAKYQQMGAAYPQMLVSQRTFFQLQIGYVNAFESIWLERHRATELCAFFRDECARSVGERKH